jgi:hypothetical protein
MRRAASPPLSSTSTGAGGGRGGELGVRVGGGRCREVETTPEREQTEGVAAGELGSLSSLDED